MFFYIIYYHVTYVYVFLYIFLFCFVLFFSCLLLVLHSLSVDPLSIIANGFHLPLLQRGMFGPGVYFASDSDKSRHFAVTNHLLLCKHQNPPFVLHPAEPLLSVKCCGQDQEKKITRV